MQVAMTLVFALVLGWIGATLYREARASLKPDSGVSDMEAMVIPGSLSRQTFNLAPRISLPVSGVEAISLWLILGVGWVSGLLTGLLGVSGAFIRMPALIYVLGVPTVVSLGTNLFELLLLAIYGTLSHSLKGNVDLVLVMILLMTTTVGNQIGVFIQRKIVGPRSLQLYAGIMLLTIALIILKIVR